MVGQRSPRASAGPHSPRAATIGHTASKKMASALQAATPPPPSPDVAPASAQNVPQLSTAQVQHDATSKMVLPSTPRLRLPGATPEEQEDAFRKMKVLVTEAHEKLLTSPSADVRRGYLLVLRRLLSYIHSRMPPMDAVTRSVELLNLHCANLVRRRERDPEVLMQMWDLIFEFVASEPPPTVVGGGDSGDGNARPSSLDARSNNVSQRQLAFDASPCKDTNYMQFLNGSRQVAMELLCKLDVKALKLLFDQLPPAYENVRVALLIMIAGMCHDKRDEERAKRTFAEVGNLNWFKALLDDPNPQVAYHASRFLSEYLQAQDPVQYQIALKKLIAIIPEDKIGEQASHFVVPFHKFVFLFFSPFDSHRLFPRAGAAWRQHLSHGGQVAQQMKSPSFAENLTTRKFNSGSEKRRIFVFSSVFSKR